MTESQKIWYAKVRGTPAYRSRIAANQRAYRERFKRVNSISEGSDYHNKHKNDDKYVAKALRHRAKQKLARAEYKKKTGLSISAAQREIAKLQQYGLTRDAYTELLKAQNGVCAICKKSETKMDKRTNKPRSLCVDHSHSTGNVRGLLCGNCNSGLGMFKDSKELLSLALNYIASFQN